MLSNSFSAANNLLQEALEPSSKSPLQSWHRPLLLTASWGTKQLLHSQSWGLLFLQGLFSKTVGEGRPHKISPREKRELASKTVWFWQLRDLCSEKRDRNAKVCTRILFLLAQSSPWPLPDWDTCQMTVLRCWDCKSLCIQKSHSLGWETASSMEEWFQAKTANALTRHVRSALCRAGRHTSGANCSSQNECFQTWTAFFIWALSLPHNRLRLKANVFTMWLSGL